MIYKAMYFNKMVEFCFLLELKIDYSKFRKRLYPTKGVFNSYGTMIVYMCTPDQSEQDPAMTRARILLRLNRERAK